MTLKPKRVVSLGSVEHKPGATPLSEHNLAVWNAVAMPRPASKNPSASTSDATTISTPARSQLTDILETHRIYLDRNMEKPASLAKLVTRIMREREGIPTPKSKEVVRLVKDTAHMKEVEAIAELKDLLGYKHDVSAEGEEHIFRGLDDQWRADSLPRPLTAGNAVLEAALLAVGAPPIPARDMSYGYSTTAFTRHEHDTMRLIPIDAFATSREQPLFPYWILEWKSHMTGGTIDHASCQALVDGTAAVHTMWKFYNSAAKETPDVAETAMFSTCVSSTEAVIRVHWRNESTKNGLTWEADEICGGRLVNEKDVYRIRSVILNILEWAQKTRLPAIKSQLAQRTASERRQESSKQRVNVVADAASR